jgi:hypothetical protein
MREDEFRFWLSSNKGYNTGIVDSRVANCRRVEQYEGDLDRHFDQDRLYRLLQRLTYSREDEVQNRATRHEIPIDGNLYTGTAALKTAVSLYKLFRESSSATKLGQTRRDEFSTDQLAECRRKLMRLLTTLELRNPPQELLGVGKRISMLERTGIIPREIAAMMRTITEMRSAAEYQDKILSAAESSAVSAAWSAVQEWANNRGITTGT